MVCTKHCDEVRRLQLGCGLIEVLVAVLVFSTGMMGLAAAQLTMFREM